MSLVPRVTRSRSRRAVALLASGVTLLAVSGIGFAPGTAVASSHREAPLTAGDPQHDNTDVYAFVSPDAPDMVNVIANWIPFEEPNGGPNFYPFADGSHYDIRIDNNGDGVADLIYRWTFKSTSTQGSTDTPGGTGTFLYNTGVVNHISDASLRFKQTYDLTVLKGGPSGASNDETPVATLITNAPVAPSDVGKASMPNYQTLRNEAITPIPGGGKSFAGQADDPFFLDLRVFDLLYGAPKLNEIGQDTLAGYNVNSIALQIPKSALAINKDAKANPVIGVWSTTEKQSVNLETGKTDTNSPFVQVSRLGQPLVNEVVLPTPLKDTFNRIDPSKDAGAGGGKVLDRVLHPEVPQLVQALYGLKAPTGDRTDIAEIFLTGVTTKYDGQGLFGKGAADKAPIPKDLNSQLLNQASSDPKMFKPSEMLRLNMGVAPAAAPNRLGVAGGDLAGFPNGRRLTDDVVDIELAALGGFFRTGAEAAQSNAFIKGGVDGVNVNDVSFGKSFPYLALPHDQSVNQAKGGSGRSPVGGVETGAGGSAAGSRMVPLVTGAVAVVLLGAGGASLLSTRRRRSAAEGTSAE